MFDQMLSSGNPFQLLTLIVAPAILTNSSSVLSLSTSNRFARTVDRSRSLYDKLQAPEKLSMQEKMLYKKQLEIIGRRSMFLVRAMTWFYLSVGAFAATAFTSVLGAGITYTHNLLAVDIIISLALFAGLVGIMGLLCGSALLVWEMWLAQSFLKFEVQLAKNLLAEEGI